MDTRGGQAQDHVAGLYVGGVDHLGSVDNAHGKARQIVIIGAHDTGVLGHLAAHQRAAGELATVCHALDDLGHLGSLDVADRHVIEEEQGLGAGSENVVYAHGDQVLTHGFVTVEQLGEDQLGAYAVGTADEDGVLHVLQGCGGEQSSKAADAADYLGAIGLRDHLLDRVDGACALGGVDAGVLVGNVLGCVGHVRFLSTQGIPTSA